MNAFICKLSENYNFRKSEKFAKIPNRLVPSSFRIITSPWKNIKNQWLQLNRNESLGQNKEGDRENENTALTDFNCLWMVSKIYILPEKQNTNYSFPCSIRKVTCNKKNLKPESVNTIVNMTWLTHKTENAQTYLSMPLLTNKTNFPIILC